MTRRYWLGTRYSGDPEPPVAAATPEQLASDELRRRDPKAWREGLKRRIEAAMDRDGAQAVWARLMRCCYEHVANGVCAGRDDRPGRAPITPKQIELREAAEHFRKEFRRMDAMAYCGPTSMATALSLESLCRLLSPVERVPELSCRACARQVDSEELGLFNPGCCNDVESCVASRQKAPDACERCGPGISEMPCEECAR